MLLGSDLYPRPRHCRADVWPLRPPCPHIKDRPLECQTAVIVHKCADNASSFTISPTLVINKNDSKTMSQYHSSGIQQSSVGHTLRQTVCADVVLLHWCIKQHIVLSVVHISGKDNNFPQALSMGRISDRVESTPLGGWRDILLDRSSPRRRVCDFLQQRSTAWGHPDSNTWQTDALLVQLDRLFAYAHSLISKFAAVELGIAI